MLCSGWLLSAIHNPGVATVQMGGRSWRVTCANLQARQVKFYKQEVKKKINRQRGRVVWRSAPRWNKTQQYLYPLPLSLLFCYNQNAPWLLWKKKGTMAWLWPPGADGCHSTPSLQFYKRPRCGSLFGCLMCHLHRADGARQAVRRSNWLFFCSK